MIFGIGIDIVDVKRIEAGLEKLGNRFLKRIFTEYEIQRKKSSASYHLELAARFAAKEAFAKAIKTGMTKGVKWKEIEIRSEKSGAPYIVLYGKTKELYESLAIKTIHTSLSHIQTHACAIVILEL